MAKYDVYSNPAGTGYWLEVQADLLGSLNTRVVVPLLPKSTAPTPAKILNPIFGFEDGDFVMGTQFIAAVPQSELTPALYDLRDQSAEISAALDMLIAGF